MNQAQAHAVNRLIAHLDGSRIQDGAELAIYAAWLAEQAGAVVGMPAHIDEQGLADTLGHLAQWHSDGGR